VSAAAQHCEAFNTLKPRPLTSLHMSASPITRECAQPAQPSPGTRNCMNVLGRMLTVTLAVFFCRQSSADGANLFATTWSEGKQIDAARALPPTSFYESPSRAAGGDPGSLIRSEPAEEYSPPAGVTATRIHLPILCLTKPKRSPHVQSARTPFNATYSPR
jgi:hypothetical protein